MDLIFTYLHDARQQGPSLTGVDIYFIMASREHLPVAVRVSPDLIGATVAILDSPIYIHARRLCQRGRDSAATAILDVHLCAPCMCVHFV